MTRIGLSLLALGLGACSASTKAPSPPPVTPLGATTTCYAGTSVGTVGMDQTARTIARRTVDPAAGTIVEDVSHDDAGAHGAKSFHVEMTVTGNDFTMRETGGAFAGTGQLSGEPWKWTSWSSVSQIPKVGIEVDSDDELTEVGMKATKQIKQGGKLLATTVDELRTFDCAQWDAVKATLAVPALDDAACEKACRNFATLKFWQSADAQIAQLPEAARGAQREAATVQLARQLEERGPTCVTQCRSANDALATHCMGSAATVDALAACQ